MPKNDPAEVNDKAHKVEPESGSAVAALWQDAYDHPTRTALVVGGAAATIGIIAATRGRKGVLLIEDTPYMGKAFKHALEEQGEKVTWFTGVKNLQPFTGITHEGKEMVIKPNRFKFAFVDGVLDGSRPQGEHVVDALKSDGLKSFGTSTIHSINESMIRNGASVTAEKPAILTALVNHTLDLKRILKSPTAVQTEMDDLMVRLRHPEMKAARQKADDLLQRFILEE